MKNQTYTDGVRFWVTAMRGRGGLHQGKLMVLSFYSTELVAEC